MLQTHSPSITPRQYKSSRPFLSFLRPARPTLQSYTTPPSVPPPYGPPPPIPDRPDTALSILADADTIVSLSSSIKVSVGVWMVADFAKETPTKQYPSVRFISPTKPCHTRNISSPTPRRTPPTVRTRSGTVESTKSSANTFGNTTTTPPRVIARDYGSSPPSKATEVTESSRTRVQEHHNDHGSEQDQRLECERVVREEEKLVPKGRKRPSPLRLQTTNLTQRPTLSPITPTPIPHAGKTIGDTDRGERRRSSSTGDLQAHIISSDHPVTDPSSDPRQGSGLVPVSGTSRHRASRSESAMQLNPPHPHYLTDHATHSKAGRSDASTPSSTISALSGMSTLTMESDETITPLRPKESCTKTNTNTNTNASTGTTTSSSSSSSSSTRYENVPLPWSTHPLYSILPSLPSQYLPIHLDHLLITTPHLLDPATFASLSSEEARLQL